MNFFQHQDSARKKTSLLVGLLIGAVLALILITTLLVGVFLYYTQLHATSISAYQAQQISLFQHFWLLLHSPVAAYVSLGVITVVVSGGLYKIVQLGSGGRAVAEALGGRLVDPGSRDSLERKALNVVEEMAIASGNPVPPVYIIEDNAINAFAAGLNRRDAVIGLTQGCVKLLSRDELQGVVAHEFSHIHNGDMKLNMRLIALLHGILLIGLIGQYIAGGSHGYGYRRYRRRDSKQASLGFALMAIGYGGTFFGNIIKAAVSRQREFLADASAVQFTRNPMGISGALKKIGGHVDGSQLSNGNAAEFSHLFFGQGVSSFFSNIMATHPPLTERVRRIEPYWKGEFPAVADKPVYDGTSNHEGGVSHFSSTSEQIDSRQTSSAQAESTHEIPESILDEVGEARAETIREADALIEGLPSTLYNAAHESFSARAVVYGLLLNEDIVERDSQLEALQQSAHPVTYRTLINFLNDIRSLPAEERSTLLSLCIPALKQQSPPQYQNFKRNLVLLIKADNKVSLQEWCIYRITTKNVDARSLHEHKKLRSCKNDVECLLFFMAVAGKNPDPLHAYNRGLKALNYSLEMSLPEHKLSLPLLDKTLDSLESLLPLEKPKLLKALIAVVNTDGEAKREERELFRAVADTLNCPMPPLT